MTLLTYLQLLRYSILGSQLSVHWSMHHVFKFNTEMPLDYPFSRVGSVACRFYRLEASPNDSSNLTTVA